MLPFYAHVAHHEAAFAGLPAYAHEALFRAYIQNAAHYPLREEAIEIYAAPWRGDIGQAAFYRQIAQADTEHIADVQKQYGKPEFGVHLIWGEHDTFIPLEQGRQLQGLLAADSFDVIHNAAHIVHEDAPEAIVGALLRNL
jgi:pimeloyl-ACP methyl ester carboxylesterase